MTSSKLVVPPWRHSKADAPLPPPPPEASVFASESAAVVMVVVVVNRLGRGKEKRKKLRD